MLAIHDDVPTLTPAEVNLALQAAIQDPDHWDREVTGVFDDFWRGRAATYRLGMILIPAIRSAAFACYRTPSKGINLHPALLIAAGSLPVTFGKIPCMARLLRLAEKTAADMTNRTVNSDAGDNVISFPILRRLEQQWDADDDRTTFPDGPSAA